MDFHPSWSNSGTQFSFIRLVSEASVQPEMFALMVADGEGSNVRSVAPVKLKLAQALVAAIDRVHPRRRRR